MFCADVRHLFLHISIMYMDVYHVYGCLPQGGFGASTGVSFGQAAAEKVFDAGDFTAWSKRNFG
jgi:hypothetical protein